MKNICSRIKLQLLAECGTLLMVLCTLTGSAQVLDVTAFGVRGDGSTLCTSGIQHAIDSCSKGGGKVYFPPGQYISGTIYLKSNVTLSFSSGATLMGDTRLTSYPSLQSSIPFYGDEWANHSLIFCRDASNVGIEGQGCIDGQGAGFPVNTRKKPDRYRNRPYLLWFVNCKGITVKNIHLRNSAFWMQHYLGCEDLLIDGISVWNHSNQNNDLMDIDGCRNVIITKVKGDADDDGITLKSTSPLLTEKVIISDCIISSHCNAIKLGTESTGGFKDITVSNCIIQPSAEKKCVYGSPAGISGISLELVDGGKMEAVNISNIIIDGPSVPFFVKLGNRARPYKKGIPNPPPGTMRKINISNITAIAASDTACSITGFENNYIMDLALSNIDIETSGRSSSTASVTGEVKEKEKEYPEATMFGLLPAYGIYVRHVKEMQFNNVRIRTRRPEKRPAIVLEDVQQFSLSGLSVKAQAAPAIQILQCSDGVISSLLLHHSVAPAVSKDAESKNIIVRDCSISSTSQISNSIN